MCIRDRFTDFEMQTPEGKTVKLSDYVGKGKVGLVDFWASWCGPCRRELSNLVEAYAKYTNKNFEIVGVSLVQSADAWKEAIKKLNITWTQMSDLKYWNCLLYTSLLQNNVGRRVYVGIYRDWRCFCHRYLPAEQYLSLIHI